MKIDGARPVGATGGSARSAAHAAPGFAPAVQGGERAAAASAPSPAPSLEAVLALQGGLAPDARSKQARRGKRMLDALDRVRAALLGGAAPATLREELRALSRDAERTGDEGLDAVLREIDTRAAVELAKLDRAAGV
ncbi:MAG: hypothetical protein GC206_03220 [Alphaproteobacteria bacterium]|nr:hypothetical protein [Alphaproteobacteria bacterium]